MKSEILQYLAGAVSCGQLFLSGCPPQYLAGAVSCPLVGAHCGTWQVWSAVPYEVGTSYPSIPVIASAAESPRSSSVSSGHCLAHLSSILHMGLVSVFTVFKTYLMVRVNMNLSVSFSLSFLQARQQFSGHKAACRGPVAQARCFLAGDSCPALSPRWSCLLCRIATGAGN